MNWRNPKFHARQPEPEGKSEASEHFSRVPTRATRSPLSIVINGKFLSAGPAGVHRVAEELVRGLQRRIACEPRLSEYFSLELWIPADARGAAIAAGLRARVIGPFTGIAWEQLTLPLRARSSMVLSLCNVGPMLTPRAITMFHDAQVHTTPRSYKLPFKIWYNIHQRITALLHRRILTVSKFSRKQISQFLPVNLDRIGVVHNGVDHFAAVTADPSIIPLAGLDDKPFVVALANTQAHKNVGLLLKVFEDPCLADTCLVLFGAATASDFTKAGYSVPANVMFAGKVTDGELCALYERALCIAFPSLTEGFGLPPLEAMSVGCPALVAPEGALPEVCGDAVVYINARDPEAWVKAILSLIGNPDEREALSVRGRQRASELTWEKATDALLQELLCLAAVR